ncbi:6-phosphogluconolactonase [soil metagenome]
MIQIFKDKKGLSKAAADIFVQTANEAIADKGIFFVALTGGSSPEILYKMLAEPLYLDQVDWKKVWIFWGDERWVPPDDKRSNAGMAFKLLLDHVSIPQNQIFVMWDKDQEPEEFALTYQKFIEQKMGKPPEFDLILLGMGEDGHTASLFPETEVLKERSKMVSAYYLKDQNKYRITLTAPIINLSKKIVFLVFGSNKAHALREVLEGEYNPDKYPAQLIKPIQGQIVWLVDKAAAQYLP